LALLALCAAAACSKSAGNQDKIAAPPSPTAAGSPEVIAVPQAGAGPAMGHAAPVPSAPPGAAEDERFKLKPEEGKLAIEPPADAKAGAESIAKITVTPGAGYHVNTEYPIKLTLTSTTGVALPKAEFVAGG